MEQGTGKKKAPPCIVHDGALIGESARYSAPAGAARGEGPPPATA
jgi:hypothetical protein